MPRYDYYCKLCDEHIDIDKRLPDFDRIELCAACGAEMERKITAPPFHLLGGGWASTGYQKDHITFKMKDKSSYTVPYDTRKLKKEDK